MRLPRRRGSERDVRVVYEPNIARQALLTNMHYTLWFTRYAFHTQMSPFIWFPFDSSAKPIANTLFPLDTLFLLLIAVLILLWYTFFKVYFFNMNVNLLICNILLEIFKFAALKGKNLREVFFSKRFFYYFFNGTSPFWLGSTTEGKCSPNFREVAGSNLGPKCNKGCLV